MSCVSSHVTVNHICIILETCGVGVTNCFVFCPSVFATMEFMSYSNQGFFYCPGEGSCPGFFILVSISPLLFWHSITFPVVIGVGNVIKGVIHCGNFLAWKIVSVRFATSFS